MNFTVTTYPHGTFCWIDCSSTDPARAKAFYCAVMGWQAEDRPLGDGQFYTMMKQEELDVAGLAPQQPGLPSTWNHYIDVDDVDAVTARVASLGGRVLAEPFDVFDSGRMSTLQDPGGAVVSLWQARAHIGSSLVNAVGAPIWNELNTRDLPAAEAFYSALLGWTFTEGYEPNYRYFHVGERINGGMLTMDESLGDTPPHWMIYFNVADIHRVRQAVLDNGGTVLHDIVDAPGLGPMLIAQDPTGASATFMQTDQAQPWDVPA